MQASTTREYVIWERLAKIANCDFDLKDVLDKLPKGGMIIDLETHKKLIGLYMQIKILIQKDAPYLYLPDPEVCGSLSIIKEIKCE